ncbi:hypothetical protein F0562_019131 [Nyssa sinensis]|uniref:FHA domain-containing protein n=1 Tax=Nyssa sinensis TaxID=561372 RepID=A0A5J4ZE31_9ASTE|nr:hypothetical protein F0562_019131 [Nyssa sinensis]
MAREDENPGTPVASKPSPNPKDDAPIVSQASSSHPLNDNSTPPKKPPSPKDFILSVASKISSQPLQNSDPDVWGVLTAISSNARKRQQGINMLLNSDEHCIGRLVDDTRFQIESNAVSANHCKIYRKRVAAEDAEHLSKFYKSVFLKDTRLCNVSGVYLMHISVWVFSLYQILCSTNGTYLNWEKLKKNSSEAELHHGDIISFAAPPQHEVAFAFVFREVLKSTSLTDGAFLKRKADELGSEIKRLKGIGIGAPEGPISLDDFRSLQRSNTELRKQLENQVLTIDSLRNEYRTAVKHHENEIKDVKESVSKSYLDQLQELRHSLVVKQKELMEINRITAEQKHAIEDVSERLGASMQSCTEANEIINSQKASISELKAQLDEERDQRREEREKATADLKASIQKVQAEAQDEIKRLSDAASRQEREQQEVINKLQESEKEGCLLVETLRVKLEDTRQKLVFSDNKIRQLDAQVCEEQLASANGRKRVEEFEHETKRLRKELESEKAAREEAWAKVSALELEINAAMRDLDFERRRLKAARERIMLRETQLRAFYSTTEEISVLFAKQQEQLKFMQRTLEDEENYDNTSVDIDVNRNPNGTPIRDKEASEYRSNGTAKAVSATSAQRCGRNQAETSNDEASVTEKHECDIRSQEDGQNTQEAECTSAEQFVKGGFGSDIDGVDTAPVLEGDPVGTERVLETESPGIDGDRNTDLNKDCTLAGDTMQLDDETHGQETEERSPHTVDPPHQKSKSQNEENARTISGEILHHSQSNNPLVLQNTMEDTEAGSTIKTADLLASEVAGSWACSTAPSIHGENESPRSKSSDKEGAEDLHFFYVQAAESQSTPSSEAASARRNEERRALSEMIGIVAPDLREQFGGAVGDNCNQGAKKGYTSNSDTEDCTDNDDDDDGVNAIGRSIPDAETQGGDRANEGQKSDNAMDEDDEATQEDSVG